PETLMDPFIGEIRMFGGGFAPVSWALCNGAIMSKAQNMGLFNVLGTSFGGNGTTTFNLPKLVDAVPLGAGTGGGLSPYTVGQKVGDPLVFMTAATMPNHAHTLSANFNVGDKSAPTNQTVVARSNPFNAYLPDTGSTFVQMAPGALDGFNGNGYPHNNLQPFL